jgi:osmotically-inducible protein OsmY
MRRMIVGLGNHLSSSGRSGALGAVTCAAGANTGSIATELAAALIGRVVDNLYWPRFAHAVNRRRQMLPREEAETKGRGVMRTSELSERESILQEVFSDDELENRIRSLLRWKIRFNAVDVAVESGHVTLSGQVISALDRETAEETIRRLRGVVGVTNCIIACPT